MAIDRGDVIIEIVKDKIVGGYLYGIEVGTKDGYTVGKILNNIPGLYMTVIDPYPVWTNVFKNCEGNLHMLRIMNEPSDTAFPKLDRIYDFIFIDGDHSYEQTRRDILNSWRVIKKGGILFGHNYDNPNEVESAHPGVYEAVNEIFPKDKINLETDVTWWVQL